VVGKVLNHTTADRDSITGLVYDRHGYEREKRQALERWASKLETIVSPCRSTGVLSPPSQVIKISTVQ